MRWYRFSNFLLLSWWKNQTQSFSLLLWNYTYFEKNPSSNPLQEDPNAAILTLVMLTGTRLWFCKIIPEAACDKSGLKVSLLPLGSSCPVQTILLNILVCRDSPLQIVMPFWRTFFKKISVRQTAIIVSCGLSHPPRKFKIKKVQQTAVLPSTEGCHTWLDGEHCSLRTYHGFFFQGQRNCLWI